MRQFRHLNRAEITEIIALHHAGEANTEIAARFEVDPSTISYHLQKYERSYPEQQSFYATLKLRIRRTCLHPSARCTICTVMWDQISRVELKKIEMLEIALGTANTRLRRAGLDVESVDYNDLNESA